MKTDRPGPQNIDQYIAGCPQDVQARLAQVRLTISQAAPEAQETMRYAMPTFRLHGHNLVYFAAHKKHIGLYPTPLGNAELDAELAAYASGKGTLKFSLDRPIPYDLIGKIVRFRAQEIAARAANGT
jgi:uncharacterized protein YdhG (YjbR/CyaY superfamily)